MDNLIFDIGFNDGNDTAFYLFKGYEVVAVEANPVLIGKGRDRFRDEIKQGRLILLNKGVSTKQEVLTLFVNKNDGLSSFVEENGKRLGAFDFSVDVPCITLIDMIEIFGVPYYLKIDIEGYDVPVLRTLAGTNYRPNYISIEIADLEGLNILSKMGYKEFKFVSQGHIKIQDTKEWEFVHHKSSGNFGEGLMGDWLSEEKIRELYDKRPELDWFDIHAKK